MSSIVLEIVLYDAKLHVPGPTSNDPSRSLSVLARTIWNTFAVAYYHYEKDRWVNSSSNSVMFEVTHWQFLPELEVVKYKLAQLGDVISLVKS